MPVERCILRPLTQVDLGSGHMRRSYSIARELINEQGVHCTLVVDNPDYWEDELASVLESTRISTSQEVVAGGQNKNTVILFDYKSASFEELRRFSALGMPILLDDDGPSRSYAPFVIDSIPGPRHSGANMASISFLELPPRKREPDPNGDILVSFGGQDPGNLSIPLLRFLIYNLDIAPDRITVTRPIMADESYPVISGIRVLEVPGNLKDELHRFGLVFCSFGLTAFESVATGCAVITVDPGKYHSALSQFTGFPSFGHVDYGMTELSRKQKRQFKKLFRNTAWLVKTQQRIANELKINEPRQKISSLIRGLTVTEPQCAACESLLPKVIVRFHHRSYYRCCECSMLGLYRFGINDNAYGQDYFEQEYRDQYGRTYLEDFQAIKAMGQPRLDSIKRYKLQGRLLDIGCAFGPFLQVAFENGYDVYGIDISELAVKYVQGILGYPAVHGQFPQLNPTATFEIPHFDVVTLWYVIEHFPRLTPVLKRLSAIIASGGILAMSTPNASGISARRSLGLFLKNSPEDHYTIWSPRSGKMLLEKYGFRVVQTRITGHHPERFFHGVKKNSILYRLIMICSRILGLGDTFEIYAVRI